MPFWLWMALFGAFGIGVGIGVLVLYVLSVRGLVDGYARLRYYGFRPDPPPQRPKTAPAPKLPAIRED